jgi:hypothetical protein
MPGGSNLRMGQKNLNLIDGDHTRLSGRTAPQQHPLESIYRSSDKVPLDQILAQLDESGSNIVYEMFENIVEGQTILKFTKFTYNPGMDKLLVSVSGLEAYEGPENEYLQTGTDEITFNFPLKSKYKVLVILGGTISGDTFGDSIETGIYRFIQLKDVPETYYNNGERFLQVNENETGLVFANPKASNEILEFNNNGISIPLVEMGTYSGYLPFTKRGLIKGIKVTATPILLLDTVGDFELKIYTKLGGHWVYYSGTVNGILWDIMDIPFIDESANETIYFELSNKGPSADFYIQIYVVL